MRATWNSNVFGLVMHTVRSVSNGLRIFVETSSLEHYKTKIINNYYTIIIYYSKLTY